MWISIEGLTTLTNQAYLNEDADNNSATSIPSANGGLELRLTTTGPQPKQPSSKVGLRKLLAAAQVRRLRTKQLVSAAAKVHGQPPPQLDGCELEHLCSDT
jgi:hypothetical protein